MTTILGSEVVRSEPVGGGCIADARRVALADGRVVFVKSSARLPVGLLASEAAGLRWIGAVDGVSVPAVLDCTEGPARVLVLEWVDPGPADPDTPARLGAALAALHRAGAAGFGREVPGFIGSLPMDNAPAHTWGEFWIERRVRPFAEQAIDRGTLDPGARAAVDALARVIDDRAGPPEPAARLHGDLWSGNVHIGAGGEPWLVDPAAYGGHREVDLAMLALFPGGLDLSRVIAAYDERFALTPGWRDRVGLWQLFPLLVHAVLFGGGYGDHAYRLLRHCA